MKYNPIYAQSITRTLSEAKEVVKRCLQTNNIPMLWGPSGAGKTEMLETLIKSIPDCMQITLSLGSRDPLDFTGVPSIRDGRTVTNDPDLIPLEGDALPDGINSVVVYIDELPEGDVPTLKAVYRLLNERMINNSKIHPNVRFVASGNPGSAGAHTEKLIPTVANRMMHINVKICHNEWIGWATNKGVDPVLRAFIAANPQMLSTYSEDSEEDSFATPRTLARLDAFMAGSKYTDKDLLAQGAPIQFLGKKAGAALLAYAEATDLPDMNKLLADPDNFDVMDLKPGTMFLLGQSLVSAAKPDNIEPILKVMDKMPDNHKAINFMTLQSLPRADISVLLDNTAFSEFINTNIDLLELLSDE